MALEQDQINSFVDGIISRYRDADFKNILEQAMDEAGADKGDRYLIRLEIGRRTAPCIRSMDFRDDRAAELREVQGVKHFLAPEDEKVLESAISFYQGVYTLGVWEMVTAAHRARMEQERAEAQAALDSPAAAQGSPESFETEPVVFASYTRRQEERMRYITPVKIYVNGQTLEGKTNDLSVSGIRVSLQKEQPLSKNDEALVTFTELRAKVSRLQQPSLTRIRYHVLRTQGQGSKFSVTLLRNADNPSFESLISRFIDNNKLRYTVNVDHLLSTLSAKGYEQYYTPKITCLPFFMTGEPPKITSVLKSQGNSGILEYWRDENNQDRIASILPQNRLSLLMEEADGERYDFIYCFKVMSKGRVVFYSATGIELRRTGLGSLFISTGRKLASWRVFRLDIEKADVKRDGVASFVSENFNPLFREYVVNSVTAISYVGAITEVEEGSGGLTPEETSEVSDQIMLSIFRHGGDAEPVQFYMLGGKKLRKEPRYPHKTSVEISENSEEQAGWTNDVSTSGLQIQTDEPIDVEKDDVLKISLPEMQELTKSISLKDMPYRVVHANESHTVINLEADSSVRNHPGKKFFTDLIDSNPDVLKPQKEMRDLESMTNAMRALFVRHIFSLPVFLGRVKGSIGAAGVSEYPRKGCAVFHDMSPKGQRGFNLYPLLHDGMMKALIEDPLKELGDSQETVRTVVYIGRIGVSGEIRYLTVREEDFADSGQRLKFIRESQSRGTFSALKLFLSKTGRPDLADIAKDLNYVAKYAVHKARALKNAMRSVTAVLDIVDITEEVLLCSGAAEDSGQKK